MYVCMYVMYVCMYVCQGMRTSSMFNSQHATTRRNMVAKRVQHFAPNNVAICCVEILRSFGRGSQILGQQCCDRLR